MESESLYYWDSQPTLAQVCYNSLAFCNEIPDILPFSGYLLVKQVPVKHVTETLHGTSQPGKTAPKSTKISQIFTAW